MSTHNIEFSAIKSQSLLEIAPRVTASKDYH